MRTRQEAYEAVETYSPAEEQFNRRRRTVGLFLGPAVMLGLLAVPLPGLSPEAHRLAAILGLVGVLWISEALPMAVTALLGPVLAVVLQVAPVREAMVSFADPIIFLFIGSFMLAEALFVHGVDRRIAYSVLSSHTIGSSGGRILAAYGGVATALSMWVSNTATTAMMFPIGLAIISHVSQRQPVAIVRRFAVAMMLMTSFGASIGGMATPVGTPPNLIGIGVVERLERVHIGFFRWMTIGVPMVVILFAFVLFLLWLHGARRIAVSSESRELMDEELRKLGPWSAGERNVLLAFGLTVVLWLLPGLFAVVGLNDAPMAVAYRRVMPEGVAALVGALLLFLLPLNWRARRFTLTWEEAVRIDWGIVLLYGGGLALSDLAFSTGLAQTVGRGLAGLLPGHTPFAVTVFFTALGIVLSEGTSNTASAIMTAPLAITVASAIGVNPIPPAIAGTLGASMGFMMPISAAPNAIVYGSGHVPIGQMMKYGLALDVAGFVVIVGLVTLLGPLVF